jgi:perosamine synthetase
MTQIQIKSISKLINVFSPKIGLGDMASVLKVLMSNQISGTSPIVNKFEEQIAKKFDRKHGIAVSNGSVALDLAFQSLDLKEGDEVILPSFTIISCLSAVVRTGATPIFCDINKTSWNMTLKDVEKKKTENTKAILMVHLYGLTAEAQKIEKYCEKNGIFLIEDAAEAHGQKESQKFCGSFGLISTMSFYANKHITTGEGGMVLTDDDDLKDKIKKMRNLDFDNKKRFYHDNLYWNYRLGGMQAALGISQLKKLDKTISHKIKQAEIYDQYFSEEKTLSIPLKNINDTNNHYWVYGVVLNKDGIRDKVMKELYDSGIETRPFFWPLHLQGSLPKKFRNDIELVNTEHISKNGLYLPLGKHLKIRDQKFVTETLLTILKNNN